MLDEIELGHAQSADPRFLVGFIRIMCIRSKSLRLEAFYKAWEAK